MRLSDRIRSKLVAAIGATSVDIEDDSAAHAGHGAKGAHVKVVVESPQFAGKSSLRRHRLVYDALKDEIASEEIHALQIVTR